MGENNYLGKYIIVCNKRAKCKKLDFYAYFNNDAQGFAVRNALKLKEMLNC